MNEALDPKEIRIIGVLMEKAVTTPDQYPLTLNALTNACNQKSSRDPVMHLDQGEVKRIAQYLEDKYLISKSESFKSGVVRYSQRLCNTLLAKIQLVDAEYAVLCVLLLRGPQTPGELRTRCRRMHEFADNREVSEVLNGLIEREEGSLVARLPRKPGRQDAEYMHQFAGEIESAVEEPGPLHASPRVDRLQQLEQRIVKLEAALTDLASRLGEDIDLGNPSEAES